MFNLITNPNLSPDKQVWGGKGAGLIAMTRAGVNVPLAAIIPTAESKAYAKDPETYMKGVSKAMPFLYKEFMAANDGDMPLVSVRSGAPVSMPGMMDTLLNVGLDTTNLPKYVKALGKACAEDCFERLIEMYGSVVKGLDRSAFHGMDYKARLKHYESETGEAFPKAKDQLVNSVEAVFKSWNNDRCVFYRAENNVPDTGTAVIVQQMVFGNLNKKSATGVLFTANTNNGDPGINGEFLVNAQGEDVVAGTATPLNLTEMKAWNAKAYGELMETAAKLEQAADDVQDIEFTVENGKLYILQTRNAKRTPMAALRIAVRKYRNEPKQLLHLPGLRDAFLKSQQPCLDPNFKTPELFKGIPACNGIVYGVVVKSAQAAIDCKVPCILVTKETNPDDIAGMKAAAGILTATGGSTSHAAVVARSMNVPCIVGAGEEALGLKAGTMVSIDGATGRVWAGEVPKIEGGLTEDHQFVLDTLCDAFGFRMIDDKMSDRTHYLDLCDHLDDFGYLKSQIKKAVDAKRPITIDLRPVDDAAEESFAALFGGSKSSADECTLVALIPDDAKVNILTAGPVHHPRAVAKVLNVDQLIATESNYTLPKNFTNVLSEVALQGLVKMKSQLGMVNMGDLSIAEFKFDKGGLMTYCRLPTLLL